MTCRRTFLDLSRVSITVLLLLSIWTATNTSAQTADDSVQASPSDTQDTTAQTDDSTSGTVAAAPTLDQMLRIALEHNPDIRAARGEVAVAEANLDRTRLTVVKDLTAYRDRWLSLRASLTSAAEELAQYEKLADRGAVSDAALVEVRQKVAALQLQFRELETELPFLLGAPLEADDLESLGPDVEQRTDVLKDKAIPLAEQLVTLSLQSYQVGQGGLEQCLTWSSRLMRLQCDVADSDAERDAAVELYLKDLQSLKELAEAKYRAGLSRQEDVLAAELAIVEAQAMLVDAEAR
jgi:hypothetical protein